MDGQIVYQVRVDSSRVAGDLNQASGKINSGTQVLIALGKQASQKIGNALSSFFGAENTSMSKMLSSLSEGFSSLSGSAGSAATSLSPLMSGFQYLLSLDFNKLLSFFTKVSNLSLGTAAVNSAVSAANAIIGSAGKSGSGSKSGGTSTVRRYRSGSDYIERDKYALLHKGEAVLTAAENETLRALGGMEGVALLAAQRAVPAAAPVQPTVPSAQQTQPQNVNVTVELDGYQMAKVMATATNELNRQLNTRVIK